MFKGSWGPGQDRQDGEAEGARPIYGTSDLGMSNSDAAARAAAARAAASGQGTNEFSSANFSLRDARTGLMPHQEGIVHNFVAQAEKYLKEWPSLRTSATGLRFPHGENMANLYSEFRDALAADPTFAVAWMEAVRRLSTATNKQYVKEIRMFAPDLLGDYAGMLGVKDEKPSHRYSLQAVFSDGGSRGFWGTKFGLTTRLVRIRYENDIMTELSWEQPLELSGVMLGVGLSKTAGKKFDPADDEPSLGFDLPGQFELARGMPCRKYLGADFFEGAEYTRPSITGAVAIGMGGLGAGTSSLIISKGSDKLLWDPPKGIEVAFQGSISKDSLEEPTKPSAGIEAVVETGKATKAGELEFKGGEWEQVQEEEAKSDERWFPLHFARIYFRTGQAELDTKDLETLGLLVQAIHARDKMEGYRGQIFRIDVSGCHSQKWGAHDDDLRAINDKALAGEITAKDLQREDEIEAVKGAENQALAFDRAVNTREALEVLLGNLRGKMVLGVMAASTLEHPRTHTPVNEDRYSDDQEDRSVVITVSYKLHSRTGAVPAPGGVDWSADNQRRAGEMADEQE